MKISIIKKEISENLFAMKGYLWILIFAIILSLTSYLFTTENIFTVLLQSDILVLMSELIIALGLLFTMIIGAISFAGERENGTLESLLITPVKRMEFTWGKLLGIIGMWFLILIVAVPYVYIMGYGTNDILPMIAFLLIPGTLLVFSFACMSMAFSIFFHSSKNALLSSLVIFIFTGITVFLPSSATTTGFAKFLSNNGPATNIFHFMDDIFTTRIGLTNLTDHAVPLIIWILITYLFLIFATKKLMFEGGA